MITKSTSHTIAETEQSCLWNWWR